MFLKDLKIKDLVFFVFLLFSPNTLAQSLSFEEVDTSDFIKSLSGLSNSQSVIDRNFQTAKSLTNLYIAAFKPDTERDAIVADISRPT